MIVLHKAVSELMAEGLVEASEKQTKQLKDCKDLLERGAVRIAEQALLRATRREDAVHRKAEVTKLFKDIAKSSVRATAVCPVIMQAAQAAMR